MRGTRSPLLFCATPQQEILNIRFEPLVFNRRLGLAFQRVLRPCAQMTRVPCLQWPLALRSCLLLALTLVVGTWAHSYSHCSATEKPGSLCLVPVKNFHPTQFAVGMAEVNCKTKRLNTMSSSELEEYLTKYVQERSWYSFSDYSSTAAYP